MLEDIPLGCSKTPGRTVWPGKFETRWKKSEAMLGYHAKLH